MNPLDTSLLERARILVTGGTGSLGSAFIRHVLLGDNARSVTVFSRDETKQHLMAREFSADVATGRLRFIIGDVRNAHSVVGAFRRCEPDIVVHAAAMKQVPDCEYAPYEAVQTNVTGAENIVRTIEEFCFPARVVVGISTDKACKPVNTMGITKALQERIFIHANLRVGQKPPFTRFVCVRYGNVLQSRGSVIPLFREQIARGEPCTVTTENMTRFLLPLTATSGWNSAVETILHAIRYGHAGDIYVPACGSARIVDVANALGAKSISIIGQRPGEKTHEVLVSEEELPRTDYDDKADRGYIVIRPSLSLPSSMLAVDRISAGMTREYSSSHNPMTTEETKAFLEKHLCI